MASTLPLCPMSRMVEAASTRRFNSAVMDAPVPSGASFKLVNGHRARGFPLSSAPGEGHVVVSRRKGVRYSSTRRQNAVFAMTVAEDAIPSLSELPLQQLVSLNATTELPVESDTKASVFAIFDKDKQIQYIGFSEDVRNELRTLMGNRPDLCYYFKIYNLKSFDQQKMQSCRQQWVSEMGLPPATNGDQIQKVLPEQTAEVNSTSELEIAGTSTAMSETIVQTMLDQGSKEEPVNVTPWGARRSEVRIPGLVLRIQVTEVLKGKEESERLLASLSTAVGEGLTMVILESGVEGEGGARLYEAACVVKSVLRGRVELLISERVDIAAAAGADGVVLSDKGLPAVVARRMMQSAISGGAVLPLVARTVTSTQSAKNATALEGADFLLLQCSDVGDLGSYVTSVCKEVSIPVFLDVAGFQSPSKDVGVGPSVEWLQAGASGLVLSSLKVMGSGESRYVAAMSSAMTLAIQQKRTGEDMQPAKDSPSTLLGRETKEKSAPAVPSTPGVPLDPGAPLDLEQQAKLILEEERKLLTSMVDFVQAASSEMEEISLLVDAVKQLDELFLLVIVGEFNSGKSSVINALLGRRFLKEGVLPTTNEITLLRHSGDGTEAGERSERHPDGHFLRYIPAELLKQMNLVDTPGTNVILQRQQRLTEEFVPRADLVLFVLSVDRPLTESEVTFLRYIREWGKKIIFILNKSDVLSDSKELDEVINFVRENAQSLLSVEQAIVYPVSARRALLAKQAVSNQAGVPNLEELKKDSYWQTSGFRELEDFIYSFLEGSSDAGAERMRLKLDTPLGIAMALLGACDRQLSADTVKEETDLKVLSQIDEHLNQYQQAMRADTILQQQRASDMIAGAKSRAGRFVESVLILSNIEAMIQYLLGSDGSKSMPVSRNFDKQVIGSSRSDVEKVLEEHGSWLVSNTARQANMYGELVKGRWPDVTSQKKVETTNGSQLSFSLNGIEGRPQKTDSKSLEVLKGFDVRSAEILLDQEIREVVLGVFGRFAVAGISAYVLTSILSNSFEDLLALGVCTAGGFLGVWNLPSRRQVVKNKINTVADSIARQLGQAMQTDLNQTLDKLRADVNSLTAPYRTAAEAERARVIALQTQLENLHAGLRSLRQKVQNLGT